MAPGQTHQKPSGEESVPEEGVDTDEPFPWKLALPAARASEWCSPRPRLMREPASQRKGGWPPSRTRKAYPSIRTASIISIMATAATIQPDTSIQPSLEPPWGH